MIIFIIILGICLGSFVNAFVWRFHEKEELLGKKSLTKKDKTRLKDLSISRGRSMCTHCGHELSALDLVPVFSWLFLKGKCRYCKAPIGWQYPLVEVVTMILFVLSFIAWPVAFSTTLAVSVFVLWLAVLVYMVALAVYDFKWFLLPDKMVLPLTVITVLLVVLRAFTGGQVVSYLLTSLLTGGLAFGFFYVLFQVSGGRWIGGGDVKLAFALGLLAGTPVLAMLFIFIASLVGTLAGLPALVTRKAGMLTKIPFGPYLLLGTIVVVLWGQQAIDWYTRTVLGF